MPEDSNSRSCWWYCLYNLSIRKNVAFFSSSTLADHSCQCGDTMTQNKKSAAHVYTVELRFSGFLLEPSEISARLDLQPSNTFSQSQDQTITKKRRSYWAYNGQGEIGFQSEWTCLEDGLGFLLKSLYSRKAEIIAIARHFDGIWWCGHFQSSFDGGPILSPKLLIEIGSYGVPLSIDNYFSDE